MVMLASVFCLVLLGSTVFADECVFPGSTMECVFTGEVGATMAPTYHPMPIGWFGRFDAFEASWLIGHSVGDFQSGFLGQINSVVIDNTNGRIALVVLSDVPGLAAKKLAIPYASLMRVGPDTFVFNPGKMVIQTAPVEDMGHPYQDTIIYTVTIGPSNYEFFGLPSTITSEWVSDVYRHYGQEPYWTMAGWRPLDSLQLYDSGRIMGARVQASGGEAVGEVNDFVIDSYDGRIAFVLLANVAGKGGDLVAVPFGAFSRTGENAFVLNTTGDQLASARSFDEADPGNLQYATDMYMYFGFEPYWTIEDR